MKYIQIFIFLVCSIGTSYGQFIVPDYQTQLKRDGQLYIRWEPRSVAEWQNSLTEGYKVAIFENEKLIKEEILLPLKEKEWEKEMSKVDTFLAQFYGSARDLIYMSEDAKKGVLEILEEEEGKTQAENLEEFRIGFLAYAATYHYDIAKKAGLGYYFKVSKDKEYKVKVSTGNFTAYEFELKKGELVKPNVPQLDAEFMNKEVALKWKTIDHKKFYFGYFLEVSTDGKNYSYIQKQPYVNVTDTIQGDPELQYINTTQLLNKNYKDYYFRLRGMNYFGFPSSRSSIVSGYGFEPINSPPIITYANQTEDNYAKLEWKINPAQQRLIEAIQVQRSDSLRGTYSPVGRDLSVTKRDTTIQLDTTKNYFRVVILPKDGKEVPSFPVFVMGQDTIPPATPLGLEGTIDSTGIVKLSWQANTEKDLWGYRIYRSDFREAEFASLNSTPFLDSFYVDSINLMTYSDSVHYQILATDTRNNRSPYTAIFSLKKPDIIPPISPVIRSIEFQEDTSRIKILWDNSGSHDVESHQLFKKNITLNEKNWSLIKEFDSTIGTNFYFDTLYENKTQYAYLLTATDDDGLISKPSKPKLVTIKNSKKQEAFKGISIEIDKDTKNATISWELIEKDALEEIMVYRGNSKDDISLYKIIQPSPNQIIEESVKKGKSVYFYFNPIFKEGPPGKYSELIEVKLE